MRILRYAGALLLGAACAKPDAPPLPPPAARPVASSAAQGPNRCPATGLWAECSLIYHLDRAGLAPHVDSVATPTEKALSVKPLIVKIGQSAVLELFVYPDSAARIADAARLDRSALVNGVMPQTMKRERTLIESANIIGLLTSLNDRQRERVSDVLSAGAPQPTRP